MGEEFWFWSLGSSNICHIWYVQIRNCCRRQKQLDEVQSLDFRLWNSEFQSGLWQHDQKLIATIAIKPLDFVLPVYRPLDEEAQILRHRIWAFFNQPPYKFLHESSSLMGPLSDIAYRTLEFLEDLYPFWSNALDSNGQRLTANDSNQIGSTNNYREKRKLNFWEN